MLLFCRHDLYGNNENQTVRANLLQTIKPEKHENYNVLKKGSQQNESLSSLVDYPTLRNNVIIFKI